MKHSSRGFSKKKLLPEAERITNVSGFRVWKYKGKEYPTLRSILLGEAEKKNKKSKKVKNENS
jgi:hypothetical protein